MAARPFSPLDENEILSKDHVEIRLAASPDVDMPEVGWANYWRETTLPNGSDSCAEVQAAPQEHQKLRRSQGEQEVGSPGGEGILP